jgi:hypothetical protein
MLWTMDCIPRLEVGDRLGWPYPSHGQGLVPCEVVEDHGDRLLIRRGPKVVEIDSTEVLHLRITPTKTRYYRYRPCLDLDDQVVGGGWVRGMPLEDSWEWGYDGRFGPDDV